MYMQTDYYENGFIKSVGEMDDGKMVGDWKNYYSTGQLAGEDKYKKNEKLIIKNL